MIRLEFADSKVSDDEARFLSEATRKIVSEVTGIEDVFVYANSARIKIQVAPIEIFVEMTAGKIQDLDELTRAIKDALIHWKKEVGFVHPVNLTLVPMQWKVEIAI